MINDADDDLNILAKPSAIIAGLLIPVQYVQQQRLCASICSVDTCRAVLPARARAVWTRERTRMRALLFSCPDSHGSVRATHRSVPRHRIARSGLAIESNRLCDVDRNRSDGAGGL